MTPCSSAVKIRDRARPELALWIAIALLAACTAIEPPAPIERAPERWQARRLLQEARTFWIQGRLEAAERATRRGLGYDEGDAALHRLRAHLLDELGREAEAAAHRTRADALDPPPAPLPGVPHPLDAPGLEIILLPPPELPVADRDRTPPRWPRGAVARTLHERLALRLPSARVRHADPASASEAQRLLGASRAQRALTLRVERSFFATTVKDGSFGLAWLGWGSSPGRGVAPARAASAHALVDALVSDDDPRLEAVARALESVLRAPEVEAMLGQHSAKPSSELWHSDALGVLFPGIVQHSKQAQRRGRTLRARGELEAARDQFADAVRILPSDLGARELLDDTEQALAIARQLARAAIGRVELAPQLSEREQARLEAQLRDAREQRARLAASLEILAETRAAPSQTSIDALSPGAEPATPGHALSLALATGPGALCGATPFRGAIRTLYPSGDERTLRPLARFYFRARPEPTRASLCLRADDRDEDGRMDSWTGYRAGLRTDAWHDRSGTGRQWDRHVEYDPSGRRPAIVTFRKTGDAGPPVRRVIYLDGRPHQEWRDTNGDGRFDTFDRFDAEAAVEGELAVRAEDRDGDGELDVRSFYRDGRLVRREWLGDPP